MLTRETLLEQSNYWIQKNQDKESLKLFYGLGACVPNTYFTCNLLFLSIKNWGAPIVEFFQSVSNADEAWESILELDQFVISMLIHGWCSHQA